MDMTQYAAADCCLSKLIVYRCKAFETIVQFKLKNFFWLIKWILRTDCCWAAGKCKIPMSSRFIKVENISGNAFLCQKKKSMFNHATVARQHLEILFEAFLRVTSVVWEPLPQINWTQFLAPVIHIVIDDND